ncbi:hypothetical protein BKA70DRAFT_1432321 [Coprinopsis sp. MPI-PUGE-AT-0042]|nr:hypothetical protein BKA70DRAFT_1432321 [Coprinopsis sp. MPI-PUGE-AT-0042]
MPLPSNGIQTCGSQTCESTGARTSMQAAPMSTDKAEEPLTHRRINALSNTNSQCSVVLHERLKLSRPPPTAGNSVTSAEIHEREDAMRQEVRDLQSSIKIQVEFAFRLTNKIKQLDASLGSGKIGFGGGKTLDDLRLWLLKRLNTEWQRSGRPPLHESDVKLRQGGNKLIDEGFLARSLGDWKTHALQQGYISLSANPKRKSGTGKEGLVVPFELLINVEMYEARVEL